VHVAQHNNRNHNSLQIVALAAIDAVSEATVQPNSTVPSENPMGLHSLLQGQLIRKHVIMIARMSIVLIAKYN
jgi:hypothetical protein